ncbi:hypothetical protein INT47_003796 [Mucor saturninus]|uniref:Uncharacterized protein n=1 Tax=Mucor saturninus TaxID=64648 RepID=A0A8H7R844_9FUNG|nr:hypothetical protein INT47_003796 [Mucor saturninus]
MCELPDNTCTPLPIPDSHFAVMVDSSIKKSDKSQLFPTDCDAHLHASSIFNADGPFLNNSDGDSLSEHIYQNIQACNQAIQRRTLYILPHEYTRLNEMALDNVIRSTYLIHGTKNQDQTIKIKPRCAICLDFPISIIFFSRSSPS